MTTLSHSVYTFGYYIDAWSVIMHARLIGTESKINDSYYFITWTAHWKKVYKNNVMILLILHDYMHEFSSEIQNSSHTVR